MSLTPSRTTESGRFAPVRFPARERRNVVEGGPSAKGRGSMQAAICSGVVMRRSLSSAGKAFLRYLLAADNRSEAGLQFRTPERFGESRKIRRHPFCLSVAGHD